MSRNNRKKKTKQRSTKFNSVFVPTGLDLSRWLTSKEMKRYGDRIRFVLHYLYLRGCVFASVKKQRGWVVVHSKRWKEALSTNEYCHSLHLAEACGLIEIDEVFCPAGPQHNGRAKRYRLTKRYRCSSFERVQVTSTRLLRYLHKQSKRSERHTAGWQEVHYHLAKNLDRVRVPRNAGNFQNKASKQACDVINGGVNGFFEPKICKYGRFHSILSNCPKEVREHWELDGQRLVEVDIANCQPLLLAWLINRLMEGNSEVNNALSLKDINNTDNNQHLYKTHYYISYVSRKSVPTIIKPLTRKDLGRSDAAKLLVYCENGEFYDFFVNKSGRTREEVKEGLLIELYNTWSDEDRTQREGRKRARRRTPMFLPILNREFPTAYDICRQIKKGDYANLPQLMQRIESYVLIENVCDRLMREYPELPIVTVHDAVFTIPSDVETVRRVIREVFAELLGVGVRFKGENVQADPFAELRVKSVDARSG